MPRFTTVYTHDDARSDLFKTINNEPSLTQQSDAADADINIIMARFGATGQLPTLVEPGKYGDFTNAVDFRQAQEIIRDANEAFLTVPAKVREQFGNDPARFFEFVNNPDNVEQLRAMGLAKPKPPEEEPEVNPYARPSPPRYDDNNGPDPDPPQQEQQQNGNAVPRGDSRTVQPRPSVPPAQGSGGPSRSR